MRPSDLHFFPLALPFVLGLFLLVGLLIALIEVGLLEYAYTKIGVDRHYVFAVLLLSLFGSYVNIPVAHLPGEHLPGEQVITGHVITYFGMRYVVPTVQEWPGTVIAVNLGGAVMPVLLSLYLLVKHRLYVSGLIGVVIIAAVVHGMATPVRGVGIAVPIFIPPLVATATAWALQRHAAPPLAYIAGSLGTLIGADLLNLGKVQGLGAPVASIGGAGTFDGIFVTGILAVLLA